MSDRFEHTLEHKLESKAGHAGDAGVVRRLELISGTGRRRQWSADDKARILLESLEPGANVSEVARRHGMSPQQLFGWRRQARAEQAPSASGRCRGRGRPRRGNNDLQRASDAPAFAPVVIAVASSSAPASPPPPPPIGATRLGHIEISIGDAIVRVLGQVEAVLLTTVLRAVRRAS
jgi:transposase